MSALSTGSHRSTRARCSAQRPRSTRTRWGSTGTSTTHRMTAASFSTRIEHWYAPGKHAWSVGENLLWYSPRVGAKAAISLWMGSPDHRANILNPSWREIGVSAVHFGSAGGVYRGLPVTIITTDFGVRH